MHPSLDLFRKSVRLFFANKAAVLITFIVPIVLILLFGHVFGLYPGRKGTGPSNIALAVVNESGEPAALQLIEALRSESAFRLVTEITDNEAKPR